VIIGVVMFSALQNADLTLPSFAFLVGDLQFFYFAHHTPRNKEHVVCALVGCVGLD
jgi:hypothetical protein